LQLGNAADYSVAVGAVQMRLEGQLPKGRGFIAHNPPLMTQIALPCREVTVDDSETLTAMRELVSELRAARGGRQSPAPIRELPTRIRFEALLTPPPDPLPVHREGGASHILTTIGQCDDDALSLYTLDWWESGPHFVVIGPAGSGKTNLLHVAALSAAQQHSPDEVRFLLVDFNGRSLRALAGLKHVIQHVTNTVELQEQLACLKAELTAFQEQWREQRVVNLPKTVILMDDYDVAAEVLGTQGPHLQQLRDHLRLDSELGLHLWAAGYLERASDPLIRQLLLRRSGFGLSVRESLHPLNIRTVGLPAEPMPEGRAYFVEHNTIQVIQTAWVENPAQIVTSINEETWPQSGRAHWLSGTGQTIEPPTDDSSLTIDVQGLLDDLLG
jgi:DNA translocase FtsK/SpoIIIE-like protein